MTEAVYQRVYTVSQLKECFLARLAHEKDGLKSVVYRPFSGYGEDQDDTYPFPSICKRAGTALPA